MKKILSLFIFCFFLSLSACASKAPVYVEVNSILSKDYTFSGAKKTFVLETKNLDTAFDTLVAEEVLSSLETVFRLHNLVVVPTRKEADFVAIVDFGVKESSKVTKTIAKPRYDVVGYYPVWYTNIYGRYFYPFDYEPIVAQTGTNYITKEYELFPKFINISAYTIDKTSLKEKDVVWEIRVENTNTSNDFRATLPYLLASLSRYFQEDTRGNKLLGVEIDEYNQTFIEEVEKE